ncbi:MAG TPA: cytochrome c, partial [Candidatus Synoicihabitans sp.]|nr:cytochrome c [Candidatus Synoicihabitans sp.]
AASGSLPAANPAVHLGSDRRQTDCRYLAAGCTGCHGSQFAGGRIPGAPPDWPLAANLTPHESARLRTWSEADFFAALRTQRRPDGSQIHPVMPAAFGQLTDNEIKALWLYLQSLEPKTFGTH